MKKQPTEISPRERMFEKVRLATQRKRAEEEENKTPDAKLGLPAGTIHHLVDLEGVWKAVFPGTTEFEPYISIEGTVMIKITHFNSTTHYSHHNAWKEVLGQVEDHKAAVDKAYEVAQGRTPAKVQ